MHSLMIEISEPNTKSDSHNRFPGETARGMTKAVFVLSPPITVDILVANSASGPATVDVADFFDILSNVLHSYFSFLVSLI